MDSAETPLQLPALVVDGSGSQFFAGVLSHHDEWSAQLTSEQAPLEGLFTTVEKVIESAGIELADISAYIYCEGPGSVLGLRLCAMAIETWSRLNNRSHHFFAYNSLQLTAANLLNENDTKEETLLISDWKKDAWNSLRISNGRLGPVEAIDSASVEAWNGPLFHLPARKGWQEAPKRAVELRYEPDQLPKLIGAHTLLKETPDIELYSSGVNTFQKWTPERHRATSQ